MVSTVTVMGMIFTLIVCFVVPLFFMAYLKVRKRSQILLFFIGVSLQITFVLVLERLCVGVLSSLPAVGQDPAVYAGVSAAAVGIFETAEFAVAFRILRPYLHRISQPLMFSAGHACANAVFSAGLSSLTYYTFSLVVSEKGEEFLTQSLTGDELQYMQDMIAYVQGDSLPFYLNGADQLLIMVLYACIGVLLWMAMSGYLPAKWVVGVPVMLVLQRLPIELASGGVLFSQWLGTAMAGVVTVVAVVLVWKLAAQLPEEAKAAGNKISSRRLR